MIEKLLCALGFHSITHREKVTRDIRGEIMTEYEHTHFCKRCGKVVLHIHLRWNGEDMIDVSPNSNNA